MPEPQQQAQNQQSSTASASTPTSTSTNATTGGASTPAFDSLAAAAASEIHHPPGTGASRVFQILYRNEEVTLKDVILFRAHLLGE